MLRMEDKANKVCLDQTDNKDPEDRLDNQEMPGNEVLLAVKDSQDLQVLLDKLVNVEHQVNREQTERVDHLDQQVVRVNGKCIPII